MPDRIKLFSFVGLRRALVIPLVVLMLATAGCGGCNSKPSPQTQAEKEEAEQKKKKQAAAKKKLADREIKPMRPLLGYEPAPPVAEGELPTGEMPKGPRLLVKPGHWTTTIQEMKSNYEDFIGESSTTLVDSKRRPVPLDHTNFTFRAMRPVALAKGRMKRIESPLFIPEQSNGIHLLATLRDRNSGRQETVPQPMLQKMPSYQYFVVVLAKEISQYAFLKVTDAVRMPWEEESDAASQPHYRVVLADATKKLPLPTNALTWSSVSHLIWDEVDPTRLTPEQQLAMVDWLHWGGRLIINGPDSLDTLRGSFLEEFLPAESAGPRTVTASDLSAWSAYWSRRDQGKRPPQLKPTKPWSGVRLKPKGDATELVGKAGLFYERRVGSGTIVVSSIQLAERGFINWPGYDSFLSAALLRRPRRLFSKGPYDGLSIAWSEYPERRLDAHFATGLRMFSRDAKTPANQWSVEETSTDQFGQLGIASKAKTDRAGGLGTWSDFNPVSEAARAVLTDAAAVRVPGGGFVLACLGLYLLVLVPLNWVVFRAIGRVEWAWVAAPLIAMLGTFVIVRQAQLDIGFVRSQTEIALLELQGTHDRGILSRYTALYSSLSTTYGVTFDESTALATPFPASQAASPADEKIWDVVFENQNGTQLRGLAVSSASTKMVHSEEVFPLAGSLRIGQSSRGHAQLINRLGYPLRDTVVIRRTFEKSDGADGGSSPKYQSSWIGKLRDGDSAVIGFQSLSFSKDQIPHGEHRKQASDAGPVSKIDVERLIKIAFQFPADEDPLGSRRDETRVVGWIDQVLPGTEVSPSASQIIGATVVLAHINYGELPRPEPDVNSRSDVFRVKTRN